MVVTAQPMLSGTAQQPGGRPRAWRRGLAVAGLVALALSPVVVGALSLIGDSWVPMSDWASMLHRVDAVGSRDTPLVGPYSFHGFAHPGPLLYWVAAPLYRLTGDDPRALLWTGALVNVATVVAIAAAAWRRGRWPLLLGSLALVGLLTNGFGTRVLVDLWNPYVALLPFLLTILLVWEAAVGTRRALIEAAVPATFAVQSHLAFLSLTMVLVVWLVVWTRWSPRFVPGAADAQPTTPPAGTIRRWMGLVAVLWLPPLLDALFDLHNPRNIARSLVHASRTIGPADAGPVVGSYVRIDGAWLTGTGDAPFVSAGGVDALWLVGLVALLAGCLAVARRRRLVDVAALASLALTLLLCSVPATSRLITPTPPYLTEWLKVVGGLAWFTVGWTTWRLVDSRTSTSRRSRAAAAVVAVALLAGGVAGGWRGAATLEPPYGDPGGVVHEIRVALADELDATEVYRVEIVGPSISYYEGLVHWLARDGHDVVTADGAAGLKWGRDHRWRDGEAYDATLTVAIDRPFDTLTAYDDCTRDPRVRQVFDSVDGTSDGVRVGVFVGPRTCGD